MQLRCKGSVVLGVVEFDERSERLFVRLKNHIV